jgi:hypothetical protein
LHSTGLIVWITNSSKATGSLPIDTIVARLKIVILAMSFVSALFFPGERKKNEQFLVAGCSNRITLLIECMGTDFA